MKTILIGLAILLLNLVDPTSGQDTTNSCQIKLFAADRNNYDDMMQGFVNSMYRKTPDRCDLCVKLGQIAGTLQVNFITLENNRNKWINITQVYKMSFLNQVSQLLQIIQLFGTTAVSVNLLVKDPKILGMITLIMKRMDPSYQDEMQANLLDSLQTLIILWSLAPGASCRAIGARMGITMKKLFKIDFEMIDEAKYQTPPVLFQSDSQNLLD